MGKTGTMETMEKMETVEMVSGEKETVMPRGL